MLVRLATSTYHHLLSVYNPDVSMRKSVKDSGEESHRQLMSVCQAEAARALLTWPACSEAGAEQAAAS